MAMTVLETVTEQEAHKAVVNVMLIEPTNEAPSVKDIIVIDNNDTDDVVISQEWFIKHELVDTDDITLISLLMYLPRLARQR